MTCDGAEIMLHALLDGELDAGHAREVEAHVASCPRCAAELRALRQMQAALADADLGYTAPPFRLVYRGFGLDIRLSRGA